MENDARSSTAVRDVASPFSGRKEGRREGGREGRRKLGRTTEGEERARARAQKGREREGKRTIEKGGEGE